VWVLVLVSAASRTSAPQEYRECRSKLKDKIASLVSQGKKKILLNLEAVPYIDSAGLGEIVRTYTSISRQGGRLKLLNVSKRIQDLLVITKLITIFDSYDGEAEAVKSFAA
jgi:anti-sigma B factor antagonist